MTNRLELFTIGFTQKTAQSFFSLLSKNSIKKLIDTRLNNTGQLSGFAKKDDLSYFCKTILNTQYIHWIESAPEEKMLSAYKKKEISWDEYAKEYLSMLQRRKVESSSSLISNGDACLLCSEAKPHHCHRSILANYLNEKSGNRYTIQHLT